LQGPDKLDSLPGEPLIATVAVPTLLADSSLKECITGLSNQTRRDFEIIVIDNSGQDLARKLGVDGARIISMPGNAGFGAAINRAYEQSSSPFLITLNDDAVPCPGWLAALVDAAESDPRVGMCASQVRLEHDALDSAGMLIYGDGSSKQRGHGEPAARYADQEEVLLPSASAALYRRAMLEQIGLFDEHFFLYCEDTDLGLRARRANWRCLYVPRAVVEHRYSHSAGRVSRLKAYYVERNRIFVAMKNFPLRMLLKLPLCGTARYIQHVRAAFHPTGKSATGKSATGKSAQFRDESGGFAAMAAIALRAHFAALGAAARLWRQRSVIRRTARLSAGEFARLLEVHSATAGEIARH
jgi:GT2 family glycosyltransferase